MDVNTFDCLLRLIQNQLQKENRNKAITSEERLAITLHYLSQGTSMQTIAWTYQIGKTTVHCIIKETCNVISASLENTYLQPPRKAEKWKSIADGFLKSWNLPNCLGAIDGKHVQIRAPNKSGSLYYNYINTFSILNFPPATALPGRNNKKKLPYFFVGDAAFGLSTRIMRPFPGSYLPPEKLNFNKRLSRARRTIENSFGILAARWRVLLTTINAKVELVDSIVKSCVCLHNFVKNKSTNYCPTGYADVGNNSNGMWRNEIGENLMPIENQQCRSTYAARAIRDSLSDYLYNEGNIR